MSVLFILPVVLFLPFLAAIQASVKKLEGDLGVLTSMVGIAGAALTMLWPMGIVIATAGQSQAASGLDPATVVTFDAVAQLALSLCGIPRAALLVGVSLAILQADGSRKALGISGLVLAGVAPGRPRDAAHRADVLRRGDRHAAVRHLGRRAGGRRVVPQPRQPPGINTSSPGQRRRSGTITPHHAMTSDTLTLMSPAAHRPRRPPRVGGWRARGVGRLGSDRPRGVPDAWTGHQQPAGLARVSLPATWSPARSRRSGSARSAR